MLVALGTFPAEAEVIGPCSTNLRRESSGRRALRRLTGIGSDVVSSKNPLVTTQTTIASPEGDPQLVVRVRTAVNNQKSGVECVLESR